MSNEPAVAPPSKKASQPIRILSAQLANQIAAGEVVERPASVVKELVENSLDANATQVHIEIEQGGQKRILIRDNGKGIVKDELHLALSRHATSKISNIDDLDHITSMGFRGEALASISSVSRLTLTSKPSQQSEAWQAKAEGMEMQVDITPAAHPNGTSIEVIDLFFNTPARRKFLRSGKTEFQHIDSILKRLALTRPDVQFTLVHNNKTSFKYPVCKDPVKRVEQVCGKAMLANTTALEYEFENIKLHGWCSKLGVGANTRDHQFTFVNGRMMRDKLLSHALRQAYEETLPPQTFPSYVLFLQVPPEQLDVNVHPAKHEVRFHEARKVHDIVFKAINDTLSASEHLDGMQSAHGELQQTPKHDYIMPLQETREHPNTVNKDTHLENQQNPTRFNVGSKTSANNGSLSRSAFNMHAPTPPSQKERNTNHQFYQSIQESSVPLGNQKTDTDNRYILSLPYLVFAQASGLKALHVEILLSTLVETRLANATQSQPLLMPVSVALEDLPNENMIKDLLVGVGKHNFELDMRANKILLKQVPSALRALPWASIFPRMLVSLLTPNNALGVQTLSQALAKAWLPSIEAHATGISDTIVNTWIQEIGAEELDALLSNQAENLDIAAYFAWQAKDTQ